MMTNMQRLGLPNTTITMQRVGKNRALEKSRRWGRVSKTKKKTRVGNIIL